VRLPRRSPDQLGGVGEHRAGEDDWTPYQDHEGKTDGHVRGSEAAGPEEGGAFKGQGLEEDVRCVCSALRV
jgi:hypothetical protein